MSRLNRLRSLLLVAALASLPGPVVAQRSPQPESVGLPQRTFSSREESDAYWLGLEMGGDMLGYGTLAEIVDASDLIFVGRPADLRFYLTDEGVEGPDGKIYGTQSFMLLTVTIDDLIHGTPKTDVPGNVDILVDMPFQTTVEDWLADLPTGERSLFVLQNLERLNEEVGEDPEEIAQTQKIYARLNDSQGQVREIDGLAAVLPVAIVDWSPFPQDFADRPFDDMVQAFRTASGQAAAVQ